MKQTTKLFRLCCALLCLLFLFPATSLPLFAAEEAPSLADGAAAYLYHLQLDAPVLAKNEGTPLAAGPTVKMLAGLLFCEELQFRQQEAVLVTSEMLKGVGGFQLKIKAGDILTVEQLLYASICGSYNDAYYILAHFLSGSIPGFAERMNRRAEELGATGSSFTEPSGVEDSSTTTVTDLSKIALAAYQNELYMRISSTARYSMEATGSLSARIINNRNALIASTTTTKYYNSKCRGMVAGSTTKSGNCVVTVASNKGQEYLCIVMGATAQTEETNNAYLLANRMINWVYGSYGEMEVLSPDTVLCTVPVTLSLMTTEVEVHAKEPVRAYLPLGLEVGKDITYSIRLEHTTLEAPVSEDTFVGYVAILYGEQVLAIVPIYTVSSAERNGFLGRLSNMKDFLSERKVLAGGIFFFVVLTAWIVTEYLLIKYRRDKWKRYFRRKRAKQARAKEKEQK